MIPIPSVAIKEVARQVEDTQGTRTEQGRDESTLLNWKAVKQDATTTKTKKSVVGITSEDERRRGTGPRFGGKRKNRAARRKEQAGRSLVEVETKGKRKAKTLGSNNSNPNLNIKEIQLSSSDPIDNFVASSGVSPGSEVTTTSKSPGFLLAMAAAVVTAAVTFHFASILRGFIPKSPKRTKDSSVVVAIGEEQGDKDKVAAAMEVELEENLDRVENLDRSDWFDGKGRMVSDEVLMERLYRKLVAAKELHESQQAQNNEQLSFARNEINQMQNKIVSFQSNTRRLESDLASAKDAFQRTLEERDEEIAQLKLAVGTGKAPDTKGEGKEQVLEMEKKQHDLEVALRGAKVQLEEKKEECLHLKSTLADKENLIAQHQETERRHGDNLSSIEEIVKDMQKKHEKDYHKYVDVHFSEETDLLSTLKSKTDFVYDQLMRSKQESGPEAAAEEEEEEKEEEGLDTRGVSLDSLEAQAGKMPAELDSALWTEEVEALKQVNHTLHELLLGKRKAYTTQASELLFKMLQLKYELATLRFQSSSQRNGASNGNPAILVPLEDHNKTNTIEPASHDPHNLTF